MCFTNRKVGEGITLIEDYSVSKMYLIEGKNSALLIDTGVGFAGLKNYVRTLTSLPLQVVITHGHFDHAGGICEFDTVYMSGEDRGMLSAVRDKDYKLQYARKLCGKYCLGQELGIENYADTSIMPQILNLEDGQKFELGGRTVTAVSSPGHTGGTTVFFDDLTDSLFLGDACNPSSYLFLEESTSIRTYLLSVRKLEEMASEIRHCFFQHDYGDIWGEGPVSIISDVRECCEKILGREDAAAPFTREAIGGLAALQPLSANVLNDQLMRLDGKLGNVIYSAEHI